MWFEVWIGAKGEFQTTHMRLSILMYAKKCERINFSLMYIVRESKMYTQSCRYSLG